MGVVRSTHDALALDQACRRHLVQFSFDARSRPHAQLFPEQPPRDSILFTYWDNLEYGLRNGHRGILNRTSPGGWLSNRRPHRLEPRRGESDCSTLLFTSALNPTVMK